MTEENRYTITFSTWNEVAALYQDKFMDLDLYNDSYDMFCNLLTTANARILDIGCGPGNISRYLLLKQPGLHIHGTDIAPNMIALAKTNNPAATFEVLDSREIDRLETKFNGIISGFCIPYLSKKDCDKFIKDCYNLLETGGILYLSFVEGNHDQSGYKTASTGDKTYFYYYESSGVVTELKKQHFEIIQTVQKEYSRQPNDEVHTIIIAGK